MGNRTGVRMMGRHTSLVVAFASLFSCSSDDAAQLGERSSELQRGPEAMVYNLGWRVDQHVRFVVDVNHDRRADLVGIGNDGVYFALAQESGGFAEPTQALTSFGNAQGWNPQAVRTLVDVTGDGFPEVVGFGNWGVEVALNTDQGFDGGGTWTTDYSPVTGWTSADAFFVRDVTGDGAADIVGINDWGVYVAPSVYNGQLDQWSFGAKQLWLRGFSSTTGWNGNRDVRLVTDINSDGLADLVGFKDDGVYVSMSNGARFSTPQKVSDQFGANLGWQMNHVRTVANLNGDRYADLIGIGPSGVQVALGNGAGFQTATMWSTKFGDTDGWDGSKDVRLIGDVDGDGRDDVVGINGDHVYVAHNNGAGFDTPEAITDDFTKVKGWDVAKHPRFLGDVDGDGQLELVGFFNDAVYWDRLTPSPSIPTDWTTPTCAASQLAPPSSGFCAGPWRYTETERVVSQHWSCAQICAANAPCAKWENGVTTTTGYVSTPFIGSGVRSCVQRCGHTGSCAAPSCSGTITQPTAECQNDANARLAVLRNASAASVAAETSFDSPAAQNQRSIDAQNAASVTPTYFVEKYEYDTTSGPGGSFVRWKERWKCQETVKTPAPTTAPNEACGCNAWVNGTCEHDTGTPTTKFTAPGVLRPTGPGISDQVCLTYDDLPTTTPAQVQAKFEKLWSAQSIAPDTVSSDDYKRALVNRLKLVYELWGEKLATDVAPSQLQRALSLYKDFPDINPSCASVDAPIPPDSCAAASVNATRGELIRCQRLKDKHASEGVASLALTECADLLKGYIDLVDQPTDAVCGGSHLREVAAKTLLVLEDKQLGVINSAPTTLGALPRQLYLLDTWYAQTKRAADAEVFDSPDQQRRDTSYLIGRFWDRIRAKSGADAQLASLSASSTTSEAEQALGLSALASRQADQAVVTALFTTPGMIMPERKMLDSPPLHGLPLLAMLGDTLKPFVDDLDGLAVYHDIACQFRDCRAPSTNTPSRKAWNILASLESPNFASTVAQNPFALGSWNTVLTQVATKQSVLTQAINEAVGPAGFTKTTNESDVPALARPLWMLVKHAQAFHDHYEATGLFDSTGQNRLQGSLLEQSQQIVVNTLRMRANTLDGTVKQYRDGLLSAIQAQLTVMTTGAQLKDLTNQRERKVVEMSQKAANIEGLRASGDDEARTFGSLAASFAQVQAALDQGAFVQSGNTENFELDGRSGRYTGSFSSIADVAVHTMTNLDAGKMLLVQTGGSWSPTCSISEKKFLRDEDGDAVAADLSDAVIGPEGYTLSVSNTGIAAHSSGYARTAGASLERSYQYCATSGLLKAVGVDAQMCMKAEASLSASHSWTGSNGTESRTTAAFSTGLRLDNTPFRDAPVGSLLVVLVDPATGSVRDVRVVQGGTTSILIEGPTTAYFVTNDKQCATAATDHKLSISVRPVVSVTAVATQALAAMGDVLAELRAQQTTLAAQGTMLPSQATLLRQTAAQKLQARLGSINVAELPGPLASLFEAFVSHEIVATERRIEIAAVQRSLDLDLIELRMVDDEMKAGADRGRLQRLIPQWILRDLDHEYLRANLVDLLTVSRDYLKPILELWYPHALDNAAVSTEINALLNADVDTSLVSLAASGQKFVNSLLTAYDNATFGAKPSGTELPVVVLSFPRPGATPTNMFWRQADAARAKRVWQAIDSHTTAHFEITPEDIYSRIGGDAVLSCNELVPVIKNMTLYVVRPGADASNTVMNSIGRTFQASGAANQSFVTLDGPRVYQLADPNNEAVSVWRAFNLPVRYGESEASVATVRAPHTTTTRPVGLSAVGAFDVDFSVVPSLPQQGGFSPTDDMPATEVQLVLEIDSRASGSLPTWVNRCK